MPFCSGCGSAMGDAALFCANCGTRVGMPPQPGTARAFVRRGADPLVSPIFVQEPSGWSMIEFDGLRTPRPGAMPPSLLDDLVEVDLDQTLAARQAQVAADQMRACGEINPVLVCPHCQTRGAVRTAMVQKKSGISGGKMTAAVITGGLSVIATGLSAKELVTQAHCDNCGSNWHY